MKIRNRFNNQLQCWIRHNNLCLGSLVMAFDVTICDNTAVSAAASAALQPAGFALPPKPDAAFLAMTVLEEFTPRKNFVIHSSSDSPTQRKAHLLHNCTQLHGATTRKSTT